MSEPVNGDELLKRVKPQLRETATEICLRPDLVERHEELSEQLQAAQAKAGGGRLNGEGSPAEAKRIAKEITELEAEIQRHSAWFRFRALPKDEYQALCTEHPPREDNRIDFMIGHNQQAVSNALVRKCLIDPVFSDKGWESFEATCAPSEWSELQRTADEANGGDSAPPKSELASRILARLDSD